MYSIQERQALTLQDRGEQVHAQRAAFERTVTEFTALMIAEYEFNAGPRGVSAYGSLIEAKTVAANTFTDLVDRVDQGIEAHYLKDARQ